MTQAKPRMIFDRLLVEKEEQEQTRASGIVLPEMVNDAEVNFGTVLIAGPGKQDGEYFIENPVKEGDRIVYGKYAGNDVKLDEIEYTILQPTDVFMILEEV